MVPVIPPGLLVTLEARLLPSEERWTEDVGLEPRPAPSPVLRPDSLKGERVFLRP